MNPRFCNPTEHGISRRRVLGAIGGTTAGLGLGALGGMVQPAVGEELAKSDKQILLLWLDGGMSQLESWDPKPNTRFRSS